MSTLHLYFDGRRAAGFPRLGRRRGDRLLGAFLRSRAGNAAVEFALIAPVLIVVVFGTIVFGLYFGVLNSVQQLASEAARASVAGVTEAERRDLARRFIQSAIPSYGLLRPYALSVSAGFEPADPNLFTVTLVYDASSLGLGAFSGVVPVPIDRVERSATIRRGGA